MSLPAAIRFIRASAFDALRHLSDAELLRRFKEERDEAAFRELVDRYESLVRSASLRVTRQRHAVDDAVQATFLTLARKAHTIRRPEALPGWLFRVARSVTERAQQISPLQEDLPDPTPSPLDLLSTREMLALIDEELNRLSASHRSAILLCNIEGLTVEEVAQHLGTTHGTVRGWLQRGREQLRRRLAQRGVQLSVAMTLLASFSETRATALVRDSIVQCALGKQPASAAVAQLATTGSSSLLPTMVVGATVTILVSSLLLLMPAAEKEPPKNEAPKVLAVADDSLPEGAIARIGSPRLSHTGLVAAVAISSDNRWLASASSDRMDKSVRIWDLRDGKEKQRFPIEIRTDANINFSQAFALRFLNNDSHLGIVDRWGYHCIDLATAKKICDAPIINTKDGEVVEATKEIIGSNFSPDGKTFALLRQNGDLILGNSANGEVKKTIPNAFSTRPKQRHSYLRILFSPDSSEACVPVEGFECPIYEIATGLSKRHLSIDILSQFSRSNNSAFLANGSEIIGLKSSNSRDNDQAIICNIDTGKLVRTFPVVHASYGLAVSPNGKYLVVGRNAAVGKNPVSATIYSLETGEELQTVPLIGTPHILAFSFDSRLLAGLCHSFGQIALWDVEKKSSHPLSADNIAHTTRFDAQGYLQLDSLNRKQIVDWKNHKILSNVFYTRTSASQCFTSDNKFYIDIELPKNNVAICHTFIRETTTQKVVGKIEGIAGITDAMRFVDRDRLLVTVTYDDVLSVWDVASRKLLWSEQYPKDSITYAGANIAIRFFDGANPCVAICSYITQTNKTFLDTWDLRRRVKISSIELPILPNEYFDLSKDGKYIVVEIDKAISLLRASDGMTIHRLYHPPGPFHDQNVLRCDFSHDGSKILTTDSSGIIRLWELASGKLIQTFTGHQGTTKASFSPDDRWIAGVSCDAPVFIWDVYGIKTHDRFDGERLWKGLADADAVRAFKAVRELMASPKEAMALLKEKLKPETFDQKKLDQLVADLASPRFAVREKSSSELAKYGKDIEAFLRRSYEASTDEEAKQRLKALLDQAATFTPEMLRTRRALDVLEHVEAREARELLEKLSRGSSLGSQAELAKEALSRLSAR